MNAIYLDQALLRSLDWQSAGSLSSAYSPFGLIVKNKSKDYWIVRSERLLELEFSPDSGQFLIHYPADQTLVGLAPFRPNVVDRFISWLQFGNASKVSSKAIQEEMTRIRVEKSRLLEQFDEGDITTREFLTGLDSLEPQEIDAMLRNERKLRSVLELPRRKWRVLGAMLFVFAAGIFISPVLYQKIFGYKNAEECVLARGGSRGTVHACYELYPGVSDARK